MFDSSSLLYGIAVLMAALYVPALFAPKSWGKAISQISKDAGNIRTWGVVLLIISFLFLTNSWNIMAASGWLMLIPILGWILLIKGIFLLWFPNFGMKMYKAWVGSSTSMVTFTAILGLLVAVAAVYAGYNLV